VEVARRPELAAPAVAVAPLVGQAVLLCPLRRNPDNRCKRAALPGHIVDKSK